MGFGGSGGFLFTWRGGFGCGWDARGAVFLLCVSEAFHNVTAEHFEGFSLLVKQSWVLLDVHDTLQERRFGNPLVFELFPVFWASFELAGEMVMLENVVE